MSPRPLTTLRRYLADLDMDPARLDWVEERIATFHDLARKHKVDPAEFPALTKSLTTELETLEGADARLDAMHAELEQLEQAYLSAASKLSRARSKAAKKMSREVSALMQALGMPGGRFEVVINKTDGAYSEHGRDRIEFKVTANAGQPPGALGKVASGGELSRISLAVQVIAADVAPTGCLVFDEVDAGVGGGVAEIVGRRLRELGERRQVLCVTHLPQVASQAHHHVRVSKLSDGNTTRTALKALTLRRECGGNCAHAGRRGNHAANPRACPRDDPERARQLAAQRRRFRWGQSSLRQCPYSISA